MLLHRVHACCYCCCCCCCKSGCCSGAKVASFCCEEDGWRSAPHAAAAVVARERSEVQRCWEDALRRCQQMVKNLYGLKLLRELPQRSTM